ncbi:MAG: hypothetical protein ACXQTN_02730 [Methanoculleaceae archaeon]
MVKIDKVRMYLQDYIARVGQLAGDIDPDTGHALASAVMMFQFGVYRRSVSWIDEALKAGLPGVVKRAAEILKAWGEERIDTQTRLRSRYGFEGERGPAVVRRTGETGEGVGFLPEDREYLAVNLPETTRNIDWKTLRRENALLLLFAVSLHASPDDAEALCEHEKGMMSILDPYLKMMDEMSEGV